MNPLKLSFSNQRHYTSIGNIFSRFFIIQQYLKDKKSILLYVENENEISQYKKYFSYFQISFYEVSTENHLVLLKQGMPGVFVIPVNKIEEGIGGKKTTVHLCQNQSFGIYKVIEQLGEVGFSFSDYLGKGTYKRVGDTLYIRDFDGINLFTVHYWGEDIEKIECEQFSGEISIQKISLPDIELGSNTNIFEGKGDRKLGDVLGGSCSIFDRIEFYSGYKHLLESTKDYISLDILGNNLENKVSLFLDNLDITSLESFKEVVSSSGKNIYIYTKHKKVIEDFLEYNSIHNITIVEVTTHILKSFYENKEFSSRKPIYVICDDIINSIFTKRRIKRKLSEDVDLLMKIKKGDHIIHIDHGIGIFHEIVQREIGNIKKEFVELHYKENDKLFVPITEVARISKYIGVENPKLTPLSGKIWEKKIRKIREDIQHIAEELLETFAQRKLRSGIAFQRHQESINIFQSKFPYSYTSCQEHAIEEILTDMSKDTVMDRLLVGDVGFGKTEIAFNAIFNALQNKRQVAFIAPLVVLAYEHYEKAIERFEDFGYKIEVVTRMESQKNITRIQKGLLDGTIDLVIGTHRLLGENINFKDLGLIVIDEEHKFGVQDKEKIKSMKSEIDVLSMSATPIPRSLNLALSGIRNISVLKTPPIGRKNIDTLISPYNEQVILEAGKREFQRNGQVFFVHNRVVNIEVYKKNIQKIFPNKKIVITHGQLPGDELENRIMDFKHKKYDILLSTTVIENGIDFSNVNTIFINECQSFGISQLHQLRGRVGRSDKKGYCYLLYKKENLSNETAKRLQSVVNYSYLGAGFELAMKDLEVRGGGDILGIRQSGQVQEIGVSMFLKMLEEKIEELREKKQGQKRVSISFPKIELQISAGVPDKYFQSETDKVQFYREIESLTSIEDLNSMISGFKEVNEELEKEIENLFQILKIKILSTSHNISSIKSIGVNYQIDFFESTTLDTLKEFLVLDKEVKFHVVDVKRLRASKKLFENDGKFLQYLLDILEQKVGNPKIKLKKKK